MSDKIVTFTHRVEGVLTDVTSIVFRDPTATYGVRRSDTLAVLSPPAVGTALTKTATGAYQYTLTGLTAGAPYEYWLEWVYGGVTSRQNRQFTAGAAATTLYASVADMIEAWGQRTMVELSNLNAGQTTVDEPRLTRAVIESEAELHASLRAGPYAVPLSGLSADDLTLIRDIVCRRALAWLHEHRTGGKLDVDAEGKPVASPAAGHLRVFQAWVRRINSGGVRLSAARRHTGPTGIIVVGDRRELQ